MLRAADGDDVCTIAVGFFLAYAGDGEELGDGLGSCNDETVEDAVGEDDECGLAGLRGFVFAPITEVGFESFLRGGVGGSGLIALGFERGFGGFGGTTCA